MISLLAATLLAGLALQFAADCHYKYPKKINPRKIRLCSSQQWDPASQSLVIDADPAVLQNSSLFCSRTSVVRNYFSLVNLPITSHSRIDVAYIERSCDMVISVTNGLTFYDTFHSITNKPLVLAYPSNNSDILLTWSDKLHWKDWMIRIGLGHYVAKPIDLAAPTFPFILKETVSEGSKGVFVVKDQQELQSKLAYFRDSNISRYFGEEALTGMGRLHGVVYLSAFRGRLLSIQCYLYKFRDFDNPESARQQLEQSVFLSTGNANGKPRPTVYRVNYDENDLAAALRKVAKKAQFTGVMCIKFKMNPFGRIVFLGFEPTWCRDLQRVDTVFMEAYLPLAFYIHAYIRRRLRGTGNSALSGRLQRIVDSSHVWFDDKNVQQLASRYGLSDDKNKAMMAELPNISLFDLSFS